MRSFEIKIRINRVVDGDSLVVEKRGWLSFLRKPKPFPVRLYAIDAPEMSQPYGKEAKEAMRKMARGSFRLDTVNVDRYGRVVGVVHRGNRKKSLNHMIVESGLAYSYQRYGKLDGIDKSEARARKRRRGIWKSGKEQIRPWDYRRGSRRAPATKKKRSRWRLRLAAALIALIAIAAGLQWLWQYWENTLRGILGG